MPGISSGSSTEVALEDVGLGDNQAHRSVISLSPGVATVHARSVQRESVRGRRED